MCADKCVGGSGAKLYRCDGAAFDVDSKAKGTRGCQALVGACWQSSTKIGRLHMSLTNIRHALVVPRMQVRELCSPMLPSSLVPNINKKTSSSRDSFKAVVKYVGGFWPIDVFFAGYRSFFFVPSRQTQTKARL